MMTLWQADMRGPRADNMSLHRVIHVSLGLHVGGMEKLLVEFARHADRRRFELQFVSLTTKGDAAEEIEQLGWPVIALDQQPGLRPSTSVGLARLFRQSKPHAVHTHNTKSLLYGVTGARLARVPTIIHTRHGQCHGATRRQTFLFNRVAGWADRIVSVSRDSTELALKQGLPQEKLLTIHNGIDLSRFSPNLPHATGPAVFVGRLSPEKDIPTLLRAAAIATREEPSFRLLLAGDGPSMSELQHLTTQLGAGDRIGFLGQTSDVADVLADASLFALSSITEGLSLAILEAMASGLPVVATAVGGNAEIVVEGETGLLVPPKSPKALAAAMLKIYRQPELARCMGAAGRKRVENHFDSRRMVAQYESLYLPSQVAIAAA
jgi:sugar transferase (PEP-CTERM/EpsH1 system associated)